MEELPEAAEMPPAHTRNIEKKISEKKIHIIEKNVITKENIEREPEPARAETRQSQVVIEPPEEKDDRY